MCYLELSTESEVGKDRTQELLKCLIHVWSCAFHGAVQRLALQIEKAFHHEEAAFVGELAVEEEFEFGTQLARGHALYAVLLGVRLDELGGELDIESEGVD